MFKMLNIVRNVCFARSIYGANMNKIFYNQLEEIIWRERLSHLICLRNKSYETGTNPNTNPRSVRNRISTLNPKVTVIHPDLKMSVLLLEDAQKISNRRGLKLVKVENADSKTKRPVYKLMTGTEYLEESLNRRKEKKEKKTNGTKEAKIAIVSSKICDHDLQSKINKMIKWLNKRHEVKVTVETVGSIENAEKVCAQIEAETKHCGKMVQKRNKEADIKFQILPLKVKKESSNEESEEESDDETPK